MYKKHRIKHKSCVHILWNLLYMTPGVHLEHYGEQDVTMIQYYDRDFVTCSHIYSVFFADYFT